MLEFANFRSAQELNDDERKPALDGRRWMFLQIWIHLEKVKENLRERSNVLSFTSALLPQSRIYPSFYEKWKAFRLQTQHNTAITVRTGAIHTKLRTPKVWVFLLMRFVMP